MSKCFIDGTSLIPIDSRCSACLKIYREQDERELSICFDNSLGAFGDECRRINAVVFENKEESEPLEEHHITCAQELVKVMSDFLRVQKVI